MSRARLVSRLTRGRLAVWRESREDALAEGCWCYCWRWRSEVRALSGWKRIAHDRYDCACATASDWRLHEDVEAQHRFGFGFRFGFGWRVCSAVLCASWPTLKPEPYLHTQITGAELCGMRRYELWRHRHAASGEIWLERYGETETESTRRTQTETAHAFN